MLLSLRLKVQGWLRRRRLEAEQWITCAFGSRLPKVEREIQKERGSGAAHKKESR
jgi:hypothetical protein